jgi:putative peptidoglycan lipid II flippase
MVEKARALLQRRQTVAGAAFIISGAYLASRLLGFVRDRLLASHFGVGPETSAYYAAFRLPEFLFTLLVSGAFAVAFIPVLTEYLQKDQREVAWRVTSSLLNLLVLITIAGGVLIFVFAGPLTTLITPGFDPSTHELTVNLTRIMCITPVLFAISSVLGSVQQAFNRFLIFALAGVFYNFGIIFGILAFAPVHGIYGAAWGVVIGVVLQALLQWLGLYGLGFKYRPILGIHLRGVRQTLTLMVPRSIDAGIDQINYAVETVIGSTVGPAAIAQFSFANNLKNVPLVLIGSSISTAVFPRLAARAAEGEREKLIESYVRTARLILFLAIPSALFAVVCRGYIVRLVLGFGNQDTSNTLGWFAGTIVFASLFMLVSRIFFAMQDTKTPLYTSLASIPINIVLSVIFARTYGVVGLAMAASLVAALETLVLMTILRLRQGNFGEASIFQGAVLMAVASGIMTIVVYFVITNLLPLYAADRGFFILAPKFALISVIGIMTYLAPCYIFRLPEAKFFLARFTQILTKPLNLT